MFTQREHLFVEDLMHMEELTAKKLQHCAQQTADPEIRQLLSVISQRHVQHLGALVQQLRNQQPQMPLGFQPQQQWNQPFGGNAPAGHQ